MAIPAPVLISMISVPPLLGHTERGLGEFRRGSFIYFPCFPS